MFIDMLLEPLQYSFMLRGLAAGILVGIVCAVVGTYVVLRGMAFFGDALAHNKFTLAGGFQLLGSTRRCRPTIGQAARCFLRGHGFRARGCCIAQAFDQHFMFGDQGGLFVGQIAEQCRALCKLGVIGNGFHLSFSFFRAVDTVHSGLHRGLHGFCLPGGEKLALAFGIGQCDGALCYRCCGAGNFHGAVLLWWVMWSLSASL